jgi:hypothetical protein
LAAMVAIASAIMNFLMRSPGVSVVPSIQPGQSLRHQTQLTSTGAIGGRKDREDRKSLTARRQFCNAP